jgi:ectoine hydroxylase-related dioxygenase (phytanoyl-CoA dioxygenase family)
MANMDPTDGHVFEHQEVHMDFPFPQKDLPFSKSPLVVMCGIGEPLHILVALGSHSWMANAEVLSMEVMESCMPTFTLQHLLVRSGDVLVFSGLLAHAGAAGQPGKAAPRMHLYLGTDELPVDKSKDGSTTPMHTRLRNKITYPKE